MANEQLRKLARRVPKQYIGDNGRGMEAMDHSVATQLLLRYLGPYSFELVEKLYSKPKKNKEGEEVLNGVVMRLTVRIDGENVSIEEAGGVENPLNQDGDGERMKLATSDALKRCAMRLGLGLHLWAQDHYFLDKALEKDSGEPAGQEVAETNNSQTDANGITDEQLQRIQALADEIYGGGIEELETRKGTEVNSLSSSQADGWIKGLKKVQERRISEAQKEIADMKGAATGGEGQGES